MDFIWIVCDNIKIWYRSYVDFLWILHGSDDLMRILQGFYSVFMRFPVDFIWILCGYKTDFVWILYVFLMDFYLCVMWIFDMVFTRISHGFYMDPMWIT